ncbi:MauE/DoxX family redox-associated membrane protein [Actinomadura roseirufa]|uniref:MauE/DoxX family redox-associated membrane protein n=1 Tax=Actinomadura roseirufa TaxID=2094049 RepID=UPI001040EF19|nr:MauE/DoxX family redox-associated membrane protein [Actinomadura roseirufa]
MEYLHVGCACLVGLVLLVSAVSKARDLGGFAASVPALLPFRVGAGAVRVLAVVVVVLEAVAAAAMAAPWTRPFGLGLAAVLLVAFTLTIGRVVADRGPVVRCRCFGAASAPLGVRHLARNSLLLTAAAVGLVTPGATPPVAGAAVAAVAGAVGAILLVSFDDLVDLLVGSH